MLSAAEIRNVKFTKSMGGYKQEEVDVLLDRIESDYAQFDRAVKEYRAKIEAMDKEIESLKSSQNSIQNVLVSAQKLADQIVDEAKQVTMEATLSGVAITAREKELATAFELKAQERKAKLEKELADMVKTAQIKADSMKAAAEDSVARQQLLYDKLKMEMSAFKAAVSAKYKEHLEMLKALPDVAPMDPKRIAEVVSAAVDKAPNPESFIKTADLTAPVYTEKDTSVPAAKPDSGFTVADEAPAEETEE